MRYLSLFVVGALISTSIPAIAQTASPAVAGASRSPLSANSVTRATPTPVKTGATAVRT